MESNESDYMAFLLRFCRVNTDRGLTRNLKRGLGL